MAVQVKKGQEEMRKGKSKGNRKGKNTEGKRKGKGKRKRKGKKKELVSLIARKQRPGISVSPPEEKGSQPTIMMTGKV